VITSSLFRSFSFGSELTGAVKKVSLDTPYISFPGFSEKFFPGSLHSERFSRHFPLDSVKVVDGRFGLVFLPLVLMVGFRPVSLGLVSFGVWSLSLRRLSVQTVE